MRRVAVVTAVVLSIVLIASTAHAAGVSVSPYNGDYNTEFDVTADGFIPGEGVDTWVGKGTQWQVGQGEYTADAGGAIEFSFRPDVTWGTGSFFVKAQGLSSGREYFASFTIGGEGYPLAPCGCRAVLLGSPGGTAVNYNAQGYGSSEIVIVYMQDPSAQIHRLPNAQADPWGNLAFPVYLSQDSYYGPYLFTARGLTTGVQSYNTLTFWGGIYDHRSSNPISFATPTYTLQGSGFIPGEQVGIWLTGISGKPVQIASIPADLSGNISFAYIIPPGTPFGVYTMSGMGAQSKNTAVGSFNWDGEVKGL